MSGYTPPKAGRLYNAAEVEEMLEPAFELHAAVMDLITAFENRPASFGSHQCLTEVFEHCKLVEAAAKFGVKMPLSSVEHRGAGESCPPCAIAKGGA